MEKWNAAEEETQGQRIALSKCYVRVLRRWGWTCLWSRPAEEHVHHQWLLSSSRHPALRCECLCFRITLTIVDMIVRFSHSKLYSVLKVAWLSKLFNVYLPSSFQISVLSNSIWAPLCRVRRGCSPRTSPIFSHLGFSWVLPCNT